MLVVLLLVAALACLCVGLLLSSAPWLAASLVASVLAGALIYRRRNVLGNARRRHGVRPAAAGAGDPDVWVIDGRPRYHRRGCEIIEGQEAVAIRRSQADEDGFIPCSLCQPDT